ncbi:TPA: hypothetical protein I8Z61_001257 [Legionella pneumophila]|nr:hypothetical protein [Legionella pneumophila]
MKKNSCWINQIISKVYSYKPRCDAKLKQFGNYINHIIVRVSLFFFFLAVLVSFFIPTKFSITLMATTFASIFVALKYKIDQLSYNKNLFEERYKIYCVVQEIIQGSHLTPKQTAYDITKYNDQLLAKYDSEVMNRGIFVFSDKTFDFLVQLRVHLIDLMLAHQKDNESKEKVRAAVEFFSKLTLRKELPKYFSEMKIYIY